LIGIFDSLFGDGNWRSVDVVAHHIWMTTDDKFAGIDGELGERWAADTVVISLVADFPVAAGCDIIFR
jgi:hypothetical protein